MNEDPSEQVQAEQTHPAATSHADGAASLAPLPQAGGVGGGLYCAAALDCFACGSQ